MSAEGFLLWRAGGDSENDENVQIHLGRRPGGDVTTHPSAGNHDVNITHTQLKAHARALSLKLEARATKPSIRQKMINTVIDHKAR